jgi:hypothetical protein
MDREEVMDFINKTPRIGVLSTSNRSGEVNSAVFGSPRMVDKDTVLMGIGENRTFKNLLENPNGVFLVIEPGETVMTWKGVRIYLTVDAIEKEGKFFDQIREEIAKGAGKDAAGMIRAAIRFKVTDTRALLAPP